MIISVQERNSLICVAIMICDYDYLLAFSSLLKEIRFNLSTGGFKYPHNTRNLITTNDSIQTLSFAQTSVSPHKF